MYTKTKSVDQWNLKGKDIYNGTYPNQCNSRSALKILRNKQCRQESRNFTVYEVEDACVCELQFEQKALHVLSTLIYM